jgi:hypothetical protein
MTYKFSLSHNEQNYLVANRLHFWATLRSKKTLRAIAIVAGLYFLLGIGATYLDNGQFTAIWVFSLFGIAIGASIAVLIVCYAIGYAFLPRRTRKLFEQQKLYHCDQNFEVTDDALLVSSTLFNTTLPYGHAYKWAENSKMFLLYHSEMTFQFFPKGEVPVEAIQAIKTKLVALDCPGQEF